MKKIIILSLLLIGIAHATGYQLAHIKRNGTLNLREVPVVTSKSLVGRIPASATGITIKECKFNRDGNEWCYISFPYGGDHLEGWVNRYFLKPMKANSTSRMYIENFLTNFYMADEENFLDKLQVFYAFPMQQYLWKKNISLMQLRAQKVRLYKKWSKRQYQFTYLKILKRKKNYVDVQTTVRWKHWGFKDEESGKDIQKIRLIPDGNTFKILALKNLKHIVFPKPKVVEENNDTLLVENHKNVADVEKHEASVVKKQDVLAGKKRFYYIKVASFFAPINKRYLNNITKNKFKYIVKKKHQGSSTIRRVYIGPYSSSAAVAAALPNVRARISANAYIQSKPI